MESDTFLLRFYGKISLEIGLGFCGKNMIIKLSGNLHINLTIKSP